MLPRRKVMRTGWKPALETRESLATLALEVVAEK
jgi:hypothetical protein